MRFSMSFNKALEIQQKQVEYYGKFYPGGVEALREEVRKISTPTAPANGDAEIDICEVNKLLPRGYHIERLVTKASNGRIRFGADD